MEKGRGALWFLLLSQVLLLLSGFLDWPLRPVMIVVRVVLPLIVIGYICLLLAGYISLRKK